MKKTILALLSCMIFLSLLARGQESTKGIQFFKGTWEEAIAKSKKENKMIFMDCSIRSCMPCKDMADTVFSQKKVGDFYNANYINIAMGMDEGKGRELSSLFSVGSFPAMLYFTPGGYLVAHESGRKNAAELLSDGTANLKKIETITLDERFDKGGYQDPVFLEHYFKEVIAKEPIGSEQHAFDRIIKFKGIQALYEKKYWDIISMASTGSQAGIFLAKNHDKFAAIYGENAVNAKIMSMYFNVKFLNWYGDEYLTKKSVYNDFKKRMEDRGVPDLPFMKMAVDFHRACREFKYEEAFSLAGPYMKNGKWWQYYRMGLHADWLTAGRPIERKRAMVWANKALSMAKTPEERMQSKSLIDDLKNPWTDLILTPKVYDFNL